MDPLIARLKHLGLGCRVLDEFFWVSPLCGRYIIDVTFDTFYAANVACV